MYKHSPSRNHRSKGIKVKHILQICVLLAVCLWLIYQVKHSHEKRREFETEDERVVENVQSDSGLKRFGRKDIPKIMEVTDGEKHEEDEDEKEGEEEDNKRDDDESEREDVRILESEEERGDGDDEIDEHESEKTETEHEEEVVDEDKEREEKADVTEENHTENEENEDAHEEGHPEQEENEDTGKEGHTDAEENDDVDKEDHIEREESDDQDHDVENANTQEAQEELYRADDASSEVAHNVQSIIAENENATTNHANVNWGKMSVGQELKIKISDSADQSIKPVVLQGQDVNNRISNATITEQKSKEVNLTKPDDSSHQNLTLPEIASNSTIGGERSANLLSNSSQTELDASLSQNGTVEGHDDKVLNFPDNVLEHSVKLEQATDDKKKQEAAADANKAENVNTDTGELLSSHNTTLASSNATNDTEAIIAAKDSSVDNESQREKPEKSEKVGSDESWESHSYEDSDAIQQDPIDASDTTTLTQEERESRTDLDTLPEIKTEVQNTEDAVAE